MDLTHDYIDGVIVCHIDELREANAALEKDFIDRVVNETRLSYLVQSQFVRAMKQIADCKVFLRRCRTSPVECVIKDESISIAENLIASAAMKMRSILHDGCYQVGLENLPYIRSSAFRISRLITMGLERSLLDARLYARWSRFGETSSAVHMRLSILDTSLTCLTLLGDRTISSTDKDCERTNARVIRSYDSMLRNNISTHV